MRRVEQAMTLVCNLSKHALPITPIGSQWRTTHPRGQMDKWQRARQTYCWTDRQQVVVVLQWYLQATVRRADLGVRSTFAGPSNLRQNFQEARAGATSARLGRKLETTARDVTIRPDGGEHCFPRAGSSDRVCLLLFVAGR